MQSPAAVLTRFTIIISPLQGFPISIFCSPPSGSDPSPLSIHSACAVFSSLSTPPPHLPRPAFPFTSLSPITNHLFLVVRGPGALRCVPSFFGCFSSAFLTFLHVLWRSLRSPPLLVDCGNFRFEPIPDTRRVGFPASWSFCRFHPHRPVHVPTYLSPLLFSAHAFTLVEHGRLVVRRLLHAASLSPASPRSGSLLAPSGNFRHGYTFHPTSLRPA